MDRGQVSAEVMAATIMLALVFVLVTIQANIRSEEVNFIKNEGLQRAGCERLANSISLVAASSDNSQIELFLSHDANISSSLITFEKHFCYTAEGSLESELVAGGVRVKKEGGLVVAENF